MTDVTFDLQEQIARIDRSIAETGKLQEETRKFAAEQRKLIAEASKLDRDRWPAPLLAVITVLGGLVGFISGVVTLMRTTGHG